MLKKVRISLRTERREIVGTLRDFPEVLETGLPDGFLDFPTAEEMNGEGESDPENNEPLIVEMTTEGTLRDDGNRIEIRYAESELSGMEGSRTVLSFYRADPFFLSMIRGGTVSTALTFEPRKRYICSYRTPVMPFEICIYTISVDNCFDEEGRIDLDYIIEIRGLQTEHCKLTMTIRDCYDSPFEKKKR